MGRVGKQLVKQLIIDELGMFPSPDLPLALAAETDGARIGLDATGKE